DLFTTVKTAAKYAGVSVVSMSWGNTEYNGEGRTYDSSFQTASGHQRVTFLAATGDLGSPGYYAAYSPKVVAVGGTTLTITTNGSYGMEDGWSGSGGGISAYET